ncbi:hypothetical protein ACVWWO_003647 [Bradyrhizobium sp. F1.13.1]
MKEIQVAIAKQAGGTRVFYIAEDDPSQAMMMLRGAFPDLPDGPDTQLYPPLNEAAGKALGIKPGEVMEWRIGETINATEWMAGRK